MNHAQTALFRRGNATYSGWVLGVGSGGGRQKKKKECLGWIQEGFSVEPL